jgi:uncharacterized protein
VQVVTRNHARKHRVAAKLLQQGVAKWTVRLALGLSRKSFQSVLSSVKDSELLPPSSVLWTGRQLSLFAGVPDHANLLRRAD